MDAVVGSIAICASRSCNLKVSARKWPKAETITNCKTMVCKSNYFRIVVELIAYFDFFASFRLLFLPPLLAISPSVPRSIALSRTCVARTGCKVLILRLNFILWKSDIHKDAFSKREHL